MYDVRELGERYRKWVQISVPRDNWIDRWIEKLMGKFCLIKIQIRDLRISKWAGYSMRQCSFCRSRCRRRGRRRRISVGGFVDSLLAKLLIKLGLSLQGRAFEEIW